MSIILVLAKVAIGYANSKGLYLGEGKEGSLRSGAVRVAAVDALARAKTLSRTAQAKAMVLTDNLEKVQDIAGQVKDTSGRDRLRVLAGMVATKRGLDVSGLMSGQSLQAQEGLSEASPTDPDAEPGVTAIMTALSGAAEESGNSIGGLLDDFNATGSAKETEDAAALMLRAMIQAAKSDGKIDQNEKARIIQSVGEDADERDLDFVKAQLDAELDVEALARDTPAGQVIQVYSMSLMSIRVDTSQEALYLDRLAQALGLSQAVVNALHVQVGCKPLYL